MNRRTIHILMILIILIINLLVPMKNFAEGELNIKAKSAILMDYNTRKVIYEQNPNEKLYPASLTKIATAIYAIENGDLDSMVTVSENAYGTIGSSVFLEEGEKHTLKQLIIGLLVNSGNDAGVAIAEHLSGDVETFSEDLNEYLESNIGVKNTHFTNPHGLYDANHYTTAEDLAMITQYAMKNKVFREIFGITEMDWDGEKWDTTLYTHHKLLREMPYPGVNGGKTGYIEEAGFTLATTATRGNLNLIVITLDAEVQDIPYQDTVALLDYGFNHFIRSGNKVTTLDDSDIELGKLTNINHVLFNDKELASFNIQRDLEISEQGRIAQMKQNSVPTSFLDVLIIAVVLIIGWRIFHYRKKR